MSDHPTVRVQRVMPATPDVVFDEWLDAETMADWMCPRPVRCVAITIEPHVGGRVRFDVDDSGTSVLITGQFLAIDRPRALRFTWSNSDWPDPTLVSVVNVEFAPAGDGETLMSIEHSLIPPEEFDGFHHGWTLTFEQLAAVLQRSPRR
ncbi:SRPBCC family protein [Mycobacterium sp. NPDC003449]